MPIKITFVRGATSHLEKSSLDFSSSSFVNHVKFKFQVSSLLWLIIICLVFFYLSERVFSGFLQFKGNSERGQTDTKYRVTELFKISPPVSTLILV